MLLLRVDGMLWLKQISKYVNKVIMLSYCLWRCNGTTSTTSTLTYLLFRSPSPAGYFSQHFDKERGETLTLFNLKSAWINRGCHYHVSTLLIHYASISPKKLYMYTVCMYLQWKYVNLRKP